jgi:hypothetical protein
MCVQYVCCVYSMSVLCAQYKVCVLCVGRFCGSSSTQITLNSSESRLWLEYKSETPGPHRGFLANYEGWYCSENNNKNKPVFVLLIVYC